MTPVLTVDLATGTSAVIEGRLGWHLLVAQGATTLGVWIEPPSRDTRSITAEQLRDGFAPRIYGLRHIVAAHEPATPPPTSVSIVVCTRDRPSNLERCLGALNQLDPPPGEVLVVDNAPSDDRALAVAERYRAKRVVEPSPGLNRARETGWRSASGAIVAFVDDDAAPEPAYAAAVAQGFCAPEVGCVTGLILPGEISTKAQHYFELVEGGMRKGVERRWFSVRSNPVGFETHRLGAGTNMAFRREALEAIGGFDPRLDVGTPTRGGGDLDAFYRVLHAGWVALYEPDAVVRHFHRETMQELRRQFVDWGTGYPAFLEAQAERSPECAHEVRKTLRGWHLRRHLLRPAAALLEANKTKLILSACEAKGSLRARAALRASGPAGGGQ